MRFKAVEMEEVGIEIFMFKVKEGKIHSLYSTLLGVVQ